MKTRKLALATLATLTVFLTACGSSNPLGGIFGGGSTPSNYPTSNQSTLYGTVNTVDKYAHRIDLTVDDYNNGRRNTSIYYDSQTRVVYQNQQGSPSQLERGDQVDVRLVSNGNGQPMADLITVTQSMSSGSSGTYPNTYPSSQNGLVRGVVSSIDTQSRRIDLTTSYVNGLRNSGSQRTMSVYYDSRTRVMYQGRNFSPADLERGDEVEISTFNSNNSSQYMADTITVTRNIRQ